MGGFIGLDESVWIERVPRIRVEATRGSGRIIPLSWGEGTPKSAGGYGLIAVMARGGRGGA